MDTHIKLVGSNPRGYKSFVNENPNKTYDFVPKAMHKAMPASTDKSADAVA